MSDFPSISQLTPGGGKTAPSAPATADERETPAAKLAEKVTKIGLQEREALAKKEAERLGLPYINLSAFPVASEALRVIPEAAAREQGVVCFFYTPEELRLGTSAITPALEELAFQLGERHHAGVAVYLISPHSLERVLLLYRNLPVVKPVSKDIVITDAELNRFGESVGSLKSIQEAFAAVTISDILTLMIAAALKVNASDIHVEAAAEAVVIRFRIDGVLHEVGRLPKEQWPRFVSRIKLLAGLKINITDRPQDGRATLKLTSVSLDVRVSTMPTVHGESVVMRILKSGSIGVSFDELGVRGEAYVRLKREIARPNGMIITTGPTGSGKTTTLYAILRLLNKPGVNIITLEDPIEIKMAGLNQSQVDPSHDYTFARGLRSLLRQDPDICMVGEIRDLETAEIAIQAALTGHLMLSTIHTNSASGAIPRFLSMGVKPFLLAPALNAVIGQRLVRRICPSCIVPDELTSDVLERVGQVLSTLPPAERAKTESAGLNFYRGDGCAGCSGLGYKGRVGVYEIFTMNKEIERVILSGAVSEYAIQELAVKGGMITMVQDGLLKALDKVTTVEEVFRVTE
ncbi:MAG: type II/IV secretion system protein [Candidatus Magasanikbacteria bacterium]|nr:type II/IV secretion system protein [Candidatus Magasanikbacteria bacterium]